MNIHLQAWHIISMVLTVIGLVAASSRWGRDREAKALAGRCAALERLIDTRFASLDASRANDAEHRHKLERELLQMKADMPLHYVRREDYMRGQSVIEAKLDALASKLETVQMGHRRLSKHSRRPLR